MKVRSAKAPDLPALADLFLDAFAEDVAVLGLEMEQAHAWARRAAAGHGALFRAARFSTWWPWLIVAEEGGRIAGGAVVIGRRPPTVMAVATHPDFRRRGIARAILANVIDRARAASLPHLTLTVRADNYPALTLYQSLGFRPWLEDEVLIGPVPSAGALPERAQDKSQFMVRRLRRGDLPSLQALAKRELPEEWVRLHGLFPEEHSPSPFLRLLGPTLGMGWDRIAITSGGVLAGALLCTAFPVQGAGELQGAFLFEGAALGLPAALTKAWDSLRRHEKEGMRLRLPVGRVAVRSALLRLGFVPKERCFQMVLEL